jgi:hypothetical protein
MVPDMSGEVRDAYSAPAGRQRAISGMFNAHLCDFAVGHDRKVHSAGNVVFFELPRRPRIDDEWVGGEVLHSEGAWSRSGSGFALGHRMKELPKR